MALIAWSVFVASAPALSSPASLFEIDDADIADGAPAAADWGAMFGRTPTGTPGAPVSLVNARGMIAPTFVEDPTVADALPSPPCSPGGTGDLTVLSGAGSDKNGDALSTWTWGAGTVPPHKDDITNAYGAAAVDANGHRLLYFGIERSDNLGAGHLDVEFLQGPMGRTVTGTGHRGCPSGTFSGSRTAGDVIMILDLSKGGSLALQEVRVWDGDSYELPVDSNGDLVDLAGLARIAHNEGGPIACGDWNCRTSTAVTSTLAANTFAEGYLDLAGLAQAMDSNATVASCFSAFNAKSRASAAWNSELKDIAFGEFDTCDARITVGPSGVNEVGTTHTVTGHVDTNAAGSFANAPDGTTITFSILNGHGTFVGNISSCQTSGGTGSCSVAITAPTAGTTQVAASTSVAVGPTTVTRSTNGDAGPGGSGNASKVWADGYLTVTPSATNPVNEPHVFTVEFGVSYGSGGTVGTPTITADVTPTPDGGAADTCGTPVTAAPNTWRCTVTVNSSQAGAFLATASASATVSGAGTPNQATISRATATGQHGIGGNTGATKTYVDARISVAPSGVNPVGLEHLVTATVEERNGTGGWSPAPDGTAVTFSHGGVGFFSAPSTCLTAGGAGQCSTAINSTIAGITTVGATSQVAVGGETLRRTTGTVLNTAAGGSAPITKHWVDASISVAESGTNEVGNPHPVTGTVMVDRGAGLVAAPAGTLIRFAVDSGPGALSAASCTTSGATGACSVVLSSAVAGVSVVSASTDVDVNGSSLRLTTDGTGRNSGPLVKRWVDAAVTIGPSATNPLNEAHVFDVTVTAVPSGAAPVSFSSITPVVSPAPGSIASTCANPVVAGDRATCTVTINSADPGVFTAHATAVVDIGGVSMVRSTDDGVGMAGPGGSGPAVKTYERLDVAGVVVARGDLPRTGTDARTIVCFGAGLVIAGAALVGTGRRLRPSAAGVRAGRARRS